MEYWIDLMIMEKYKPNWDTLSKTITVLNEDKSIYSEFDYIDWLQFKIEYLQSERLQKQKFYIRNQYGGRDAIDRFSNTTYDEFNIINKLLRLIIKSQFEIRKDDELSE